MMYNEKLAVAIKANGKVLREFGDQVYIPFGSEYSIFIKNLNTVRAMVSISIDGEDIADGSSFVLQPNSSMDIERFLKNGNNDYGNRLKFIERTSAVEDHRGIGVEDGLVRVEYQFEKAQIPNVLRTNRRINGGGFVPYSSSVFYTSSGESEEYCSSSVCDAGITVEGSISDQRFQTVSGFPVEAKKHVMVLKLLGETENAPVKKPVTVKTRPTCKTCGTMGKPLSKFCSECGTSLEIVA